MDMRFSWSRKSISAITGPNVADSPALSLPSPERHLRDSHNALVRQPEGCRGYSRYAIAGADETAHQYFQKNEDLAPKKKVRFFEEFWLHSSQSFISVFSEACCIIPCHLASIPEIFQVFHFSFLGIYGYYLSTISIISYISIEIERQYPQIARKEKPTCRLSEMERLKRAGNDAVMTPESTNVPRSAWGTIDPEIRPKYSAPFLTKKSQKCRK